MKALEGRKFSKEIAQPISINFRKIIISIGDGVQLKIISSNAISMYIYFHRFSSNNVRRGETRRPLPSNVRMSSWRRIKDGSSRSKYLRETNFWNVVSVQSRENKNFSTPNDRYLPTRHVRLNTFTATKIPILGIAFFFAPEMSPF